MESVPEEAGKGQLPLTDPGAKQAFTPCSTCADASIGMNDTASTVSTTTSSAVTTLSAATEDTDAPNSASNAKEPASGGAEETDPREALRTGSTTPVSADRLRQTLHEAHSSVEGLHRTMTSCWRTPISLFDEDAARTALARGVPDWAVAIVHNVQQLVDEVSAVSDLADVYDAQILAAKREHRALNRAALLRLLERCDELAGRLQAHLPLLESARAIFDNPSIVPARAANSPTAGMGGSFQSYSRQTSAASEADAEAPIRILEPSRKSRLSRVWGVLKQVTEQSAEVLLEAAVVVVESVGTPRASQRAGPERRGSGGEDQRKSFTNDSGDHHMGQRASRDSDPDGHHLICGAATPE